MTTLMDTKGGGGLRVLNGWKGWCKHTRHSATTSFRRGLVPELNAVNDQGQQLNLSLGRDILPPACRPFLGVFITWAHEQLMLQCHTSAEGEPNQY